MKKIYFFFLSSLITLNGFAQVSVNSDGSRPDSSAMLDVNSPERGLLPPRMDHAHMLAIHNPAEGLIVYCTDCGLNIYINGAWHKIAANCSPAPPAAGTHIPLSNGIEWRWSPVSGASGYKWNVADNYESATEMYNETTAIQGGLPCNTLYTSYVWAYGACGHSDPSTLTQTTSLFPPPPPTPGINVPSLNMILWVWNLVPGATGYLWNTINDTATATNMYGSNTKAQNGLTCNTSYQSYVWAYSDCGISDPVTLSSTTSLNPPPPPGEEEHEAFSHQIVWHWSSVPEASGYRWSTTDNYDGAETLSGNDNTSKTEIELDCSANYLSYVWAFGDCGNSEPITLQEQTLPDPPATPETGIHVPLSDQIVWNWNNVPGAIGYKWNSTNDITTAAEMGDTTTKTQTGLPCNTLCTSYVWAYGACGNSDPATLSQKTSLDPPASPTPGINVPTLYTILWVWNLVPEARGYLWNEVNDTASATNVFSSNYWAQNPLDCNTPYQCYVWAYNNCGVSESVMLKDTTSLNPPPSPDEGTHEASVNQIIWHWNTVDNATGYKWYTTDDYASATEMNTATQTTETGLFCKMDYTSYVWSYGPCGVSNATSMTSTTTSCPSSTITTGTGTTSCNYPYTTYFKQGRTQMLYSGAELTANGGGPGSITSIGFNVISADTMLMNGFTISLMNTTITSITGWVNSGMITCYSQPYRVPGTGWQMINLTTPFDYDGTNLLIQICYNNSAYHQDSYVYGSTATGMIYHYHIDYDPSGGCNLTSNSPTTARPNLRFTEQPTFPIVTSPATEIAQTEATSGGYITPADGIEVSERGVCWSTSSNPDINDSHISNGYGTGSFVINLTELSVNTGYHVRAYAITNTGISYGNDISFTTLLNFYTIGSGTSTCIYPYTTGWDDGRTQMLYSAEEISSIGCEPGLIASIGLNVSSANPGVMNSFSILLSNTSLPGITGWVNTDIMTQCYSGTYSVPGTGWQMISLDPPFYYDGSNLLLQICFDNSAYTSNSYVYGSTANGMIFNYYYDLPSGSGCDFTNNYTTTMRSNLRLGEQPVPIVTHHVTDIAQTTATSGGYITPVEGVSLTTKGVCWSITSPPTISDGNAPDASGEPGSFVSSLTGLLVGTTYYVMAYATNSDGETSYGNEVTFTTKATSAMFTIGDGTTSCNYPYTTYYYNGRTQMLFTAAEITSNIYAPGTISSIGFNVISADPIVMNGFTIKLMNTTMTSITGWVNDGMTTCYSGTYSVPGTGWKMITLDFPFDYDGTNLLIQICYNNTAYSSYSWVYGSTAPGMIYYYCQDPGSGCTLTSNTATTVRPNLRIVEQ
jgi:hypothetical protein